MAKKAQRRTLTYEQAVNFSSADCLEARVQRPRIVTLAEVAKAISALGSSKAVHVQLSGKAAKPKKLTTIKALKLALEELEEMPPDAAAYGVLRSSEKKAMAWPVSVGALKPATCGRVQNQQVNGRSVKVYSAVGDAGLPSPP